MYAVPFVTTSRTGGAAVREPLEVITCDATECEEQVVAGTSRVVARAREQGWQVKAVTSLWISDDGPELDVEDRCPAHPVDAIPSDVVLKEAGGLGGVQPWQL